MLLKPIEFLGSSLRDLQACPKSVKRKIGFQLERLERGLEPNDWKVMRGIGPGVCEIRIRDDDGAYRVIYIASMETAIYILHCFKRRLRRQALAISIWRCGGSVCSNRGKADESRKF